MIFNVNLFRQSSRTFAAFFTAVFLFNTLPADSEELDNSILLLLLKGMQTINTATDDGYGSGEYTGNGSNECNDGIDNDGDGDADKADLNCDCSDDPNESGSVYYVCDCGEDADSDCIPGNDENDGLSIAAPFQSYGKARSQFNTINAGDTVALCRGGSFTVLETDSQRWVNENCLADNRCLVRNYVPDWASGDETRPLISSPGDDVFRLENSGYASHHEGVVLRDLILRGDRTGGAGVFIYNDQDSLLLDNLTIDGFRLGVHAGGANLPPSEGSDGLNSDIVLRNSRIINNSGQGWLGGGSHFYIVNNHFENNGYNQAVYNHNIYVNGSTGTSNFLIKGNELYRSAIVDGQCAGVSLVGHGVIRNLTIEDNIVREDVGAAGQGCWGIAIDGGYGSSEHFENLVIRRNKVINVGNMALGCSSCTDAVIENNIIIHEQPFSTSLSVPDRGEGGGDTPSSNVVVRNNTLYGDIRRISVFEMAEGASHSINNLIFSTTSCDNTFTGISNQKNNLCVTSDPGFADMNISDPPVEYNFDLTENAVLLINGGTNIRAPRHDYNLDARDRSPDLGAFEFQSSTPGSNGICGNGRIEIPEQCDGNNLSCSTDGYQGMQLCQADCSLSSCNLSEYCGDGIVQTTAKEQCDDGNTLDNDGCSSDCRKESSYPASVCGNFILEHDEECDDGNLSADDGCSPACSVERDATMSSIGYGAGAYTGLNSNECNDGMDNDGDGSIDEADLNCDSNDDPSESGTVYYACDCGAGADTDCVSGNDVNDGLSPNSPFQTYEQARTQFNSIEAGDTVALCRGGYFTVLENDGKRWVNENCRSNNRCTVRNYTPPWANGDETRPVIYSNGEGVFRLEDGGSPSHEEGVVIRDMILRGNGGGTAIFIYNDQDDVLLDNLEIDSFTLGVYPGGSNEVVDPQSDGLNDRIILRNSRILNCGGQGWLGGGNDYVIENNYFGNNGFSRAVYNHNIYVSGRNSNNIIIKGNDLYRSAIIDGECAGVSLVGHGRISNLTIEDNIIREDIGAAKQGCWGIAIDGGYDSAEQFENLIIRRNKVINVGNMALGCSSCTNAVIENNIIINEQPFASAISVPDRTEGAEDTPTTNAIVRNNTLYGDVRVLVSELGSGTSRSLNNLIYTGNEDCANTFSGNSLQSNNLCTALDPGFVDVDTSNDPRLYNFALTSEALDIIDGGTSDFAAAEDFTTTPRDSFPDIGAFEYH